MAEIKLVDTHCHIHDEDFPLPAEEILKEAADNGVTTWLTMGGNAESSRQAVTYADKYDGQYGVCIRYGVGMHPHDIGEHVMDDVEVLRRLAIDHPEKLIAIGEIGLDYFYDDEPAERQLQALEAQIQIAVDLDLPMSFHVRSGKYGDAFQDFWALLANFGGKARGVLHSFTDSLENMEKVLSHDLAIGVNGIVTFNKDEKLNEVYKAIPLESLVLETDAPYLSPKPYRGKSNHPARIRQIAEFIANDRNLDLSTVSEITTKNANRVYKFVK